MKNSSLSSLVQPKAATSTKHRLWVWAAQPLWAYLMLFLLQLKVTWGDWQYRDLTRGDTADYFAMADLWFREWVLNILWSPLYTAFYGTILYFSSDAYQVTIVHRLIIVFAVALLLLVLWRQLLPAELAWLLAAWWVINPHNFGVLVEVHLFAVIPLALAVWLPLYRPAPWTRGSAIAILVGAAILVRNELILAAGLLALLSIGWDVWQWRRTERSGYRPGVTYLLSYGLPLTISLLIIGFFYSRSALQFPELLAGSRDKETLTFCQIYAVGYKQRHPDWANDPWLHCWGLMDQQFGQTHVSLREAINRNPAAVLDHVRWNAILLPTALQVGLFGATSGSLNPKYLPISTENSILLLPTIVVSLTILLGLFYLYKDWAYWWANGLKQRVWGWLTLLAITGANLVTAIVIHPNPEYLYGLTLFLMSLFGLSLWVISRRWFSSKRLSAAMPLVMVLSLFFLPNYYSNPKHIRPRQLHDIYQRLAPFMQIVNKGETVLLGSEAGQVCNYFGYGQCQGIEYHTLLSHLSEQSPLNFLDEEGVNLIYMDETLKSILLQLNPSAAKQFFNQPADFGWKLVAGQEENNSQWMIFARQ